MVITLGFDPRNSCSIQETCTKCLTFLKKYDIIYIESEKRGEKMFDDGSIDRIKSFLSQEEKPKEKYIPSERRHFCCICQKELFPGRIGYETEICPLCLELCSKKE